MRLARGFSLIEVLVSLLILSVGLLGFASLQAANVNLGNQAWTRSQATVLASDMIERLRGNPNTFINGHYDIAFGANLGSVTDCTTIDCNPVELAEFDQQQWSVALSEQLPQGTGQISRDTSTNPTQAVVAVRWFDRTTQSHQVLELRAMP